MKKIELLAPAGNMEALKAAVCAGCDAVYLGLQTYSARAFAGNFSNEELLEAIAYCHVRGVRVYVALNTILFEKEMENIQETVDFLYNNDVDALIIQDLGLFHYVKRCYPNFELHCSTQMHIHNPSGVQFMRDLGASRVVIARECTIDTIYACAKTGMEIEVFGYGAICISYSGQCLMSQSTKNRSANKGMCAQCCRMKYKPSQPQVFNRGEYLLSPKDLNLINQVPDLIRHGVTSIKIEGRMKRSEYVYLVVSIFRKAIDSFYQGKEYQITKKELEQLQLMFHRGFSLGHIFYAHTGDRMNTYRPNHLGLRIGEVVKVEKGFVHVRLEKPLQQGDGLRILNHKEDIGIIANRIYLNNKLVSSAKAKDVVKLTYDPKYLPKIHDPLHKTSDITLLKEIGHNITFKPRLVPIRIEYEAKVNKPLAIRVIDHDQHVIKVYSDELVQKARNAPLTKERLEESLSRMGVYPFEVEYIGGYYEPFFMSIAQINETRRKVLDALVKERTLFHPNRTPKRPYSYPLASKKPYPFRVLVHDDSFTNPHCDTSKVFSMYRNMRPVVDEHLHQQKVWEDNLVSQVGDLFCHLKHCIAGMTFNITNSYGLAFLLAYPGIDGVIFSSECSNEQIKDALENFEKRYGFTPCTYRLVYGQRALMTIKDNFTDERVSSISDLHENSFDVRYNFFTTEILENRAYQADNPYCYGSYLIVRDERSDPRKLEEKAYEEIFRRI